MLFLLLACSKAHNRCHSTLVILHPQAFRAVTGLHATTLTLLEVNGSLSCSGLDEVSEVLIF